MIAPHHRPSTAREALPEDCTARCAPSIYCSQAALQIDRARCATDLAAKTSRAGNSLLGAEPDDVPKPVQHKTKNFAQTKPNAEIRSYRRQNSTLPDFKFLIFPVLLSHPRLRKEQWPMNNSMSKQTITLQVRGRERGKFAARIDGGAQSRVTGGNSLATR
jgi:hypothetical protein